jgi:hypothetical protein
VRANEAASRATTPRVQKLELDGLNLDRIIFRDLEEA